MHQGRSDGTDLCICFCFLDRKSLLRDLPVKTFYKLQKWNSLNQNTCSSTCVTETEWLLHSKKPLIKYLLSVRWWITAGGAHTSAPCLSSQGGLCEMKGSTPFRTSRSSFVCRGALSAVWRGENKRFYSVGSRKPGHADAGRQPPLPRSACYILKGGRKEQRVIKVSTWTSPARTRSPLAESPNSSSSLPPQDSYFNYTLYINPLLANHSELMTF